MTKQKQADSGQTKQQPKKPEQKKEAEEPKQQQQPQPEQEAADTKLSDEVKQRTKEQFEKLTESNKRLVQANRALQEEARRREQSEKSFSSLQGQSRNPYLDAIKQPEQQGGENLVEQFVEVDPVTGQQYVDEKRLSTAIVNANQRALNAERKVQGYIQQQEQVERQRQTEEAFAAHPELNPNDSENFNQDVHRRTRALLLDSMMNPGDYGNRPLTFKEAGDQAKEQSAKEAKQLAEKVEEEREKATSEKAQASAGVQGQPSGQQQAERQRLESEQELGDLVRATRKGNIEALAQRLSHTKHTGTPSSSES
jgi:hypothetical protein